MNSDADQPEFSASKKIYAALLRAYPRRHREEYGAAMRQLFRDQCRDAWGESKNFGLLKLWLRVLPDLASTSIMERLAALNERKTMSEKLGNLAAFGPSPGKIFTRVFVTVFLIVVFISVIMTNLLPESYASRATIKIDSEKSSEGKAIYDPYFIQTQFEIIRSASVLQPVINKLHLNEVWSRKYFNGEKLQDAECIEIIRGRLSVAPVKNSALANITVYSEASVEAAQIANAIAESYQDYRVKNSNWKSQSPQPVLVQIVDLAEPGKAPVKPNKTVNIVLGTFLGVLLAGGIGGTAAYFTSRRRRKQNAAAMA